MEIMKENNVKLGKRIKEAREKINKSQAELAGLIGVMAAHLNRWEKGRISPGWEFLVKIAKICDVSLDWLLTGMGLENIKNGKKKNSQEFLADEEISEITEWIASHPNDKKHIHRLIIGKKMIENAFENLRISEYEDKR